MILVASTCTPPPTWTRLFATLALSAAIVATAITAFAAPAHLAQGVQLVGFTEQVSSIPNVQPGDIGARREVGTDEGHTMLVVGVSATSAKAYPVSSNDANLVPELAGTTSYELTVLDSSASGHSNDTRMIAYGGKTELFGGAGIGVMGVFANAGGQVVAHTWSLPTSSYLQPTNGVTTVNPGWLGGIKTRLKKQAEVELVFGRMPVLPVVP